MSSDQPTTPTDARPMPGGGTIPPRKKAVGPRFDTMPEFRAAPEPPATPAVAYPSDPEERLALIKEPRIGPMFIRYSIWAGGAAIAYTYLIGFRALYQKDRPAWINTFRQRVYIMSPLIAMYITGTNLIPMPFRSSMEQWLGKPAITLQDMDKVQRKLRQEKKATLADAQQRVSDTFADAQTNLASKTT